MTPQDLVHHAIELASTCGNSGDPIRLANSLAKRTSNAEVRALATDLALTRQKITRRWGARWEWLMLRRHTFEQATHPDIAQWHARRMLPHGGTCVEFCTGAAIDSIAMIQQGATLTTFELDPVTAALARYNIAAAGGHASVVADAAEEWRKYQPSLQKDTIWADPARRGNSGRNAKSAEEWTPSPEWLFSIGRISKAMAVKAGPAADIDIPEGWQRTWVGADWECREQLLHLNAPEQMPSVSVLEHNTWHQWSPQSPGVLPNPAIVAAAGGMILIEPHPALIRSGTLSEWFSEHHVLTIDPRLAWGLAPTAIQSPLCRCFQIESVHPWQPKKFQSFVDEHNLGPLTEIKKRGTDVDPDVLRKKTRWNKNGRQAVIAIARGTESHLLFLCRRLQQPLH